MRDRGPSILVWSSLFPGPAQPQAGLFVRERMFRVGKVLPISVISPQPWFPFQGLVRLFRPHFRPSLPAHELQDGVDVFRPRYFSVPGLLKRLDGDFMARAARHTVQRLHADGRADVLDAHFTYPDGYAAAKVARALGLPLTITMRGTEVRQSRVPALRRRLAWALHAADRVFAVSSSLRALAIELGIDGSRVRVVGNGVDSQGFVPSGAHEARFALGLSADARVLVTVGGLVERKGFHRVIDCLPRLLGRYPHLHYLVVGAAGPEGDYSRELKSQVRAFGLEERVHFLGGLAPADVGRVLSAGDVFVLASRNEGWANVLLEAMACGLPVVATDVGGNREVVRGPELGRIVPFGDAEALCTALDQSLAVGWDRGRIRAYAEANDWCHRVEVLVDEFRALGERRKRPADVAYACRP